MYIYLYIYIYIYIYMYVVYVDRYIKKKPTRNVLSIYKLEIKTHLLKGTNISHLFRYFFNAM